MNCYVYGVEIIGFPENSCQITARRAVPRGSSRLSAYAAALLQNMSVARNRFAMLLNLKDSGCEASNMRGPPAGVPRRVEGTGRHFVAPSDSDKARFGR